MNQGRFYLSAAAGVAAGLTYFAIGERGIPTDSNCSYLAPVSTDILALAAGAYLIAAAPAARSAGVAFIGGAIAAVHAAQFAKHKAGK